MGKFNLGTVGKLRVGIEPCGSRWHSWIHELAARLDNLLAIARSIKSASVAVDSSGLGSALDASTIAVGARHNGASVAAPRTWEAILNENRVETREAASTAAFFFSFGARVDGAWADTSVAARSTRSVAWSFARRGA